MEPKSYKIQFWNFEMLISHWWRLRFLLVGWPCNRTVNSFPKWYDTWKSAQKWGRESQIFNLVIYLTNTKKIKKPWLGAPGTFFGIFQWYQGMFLKGPEGFQRKKVSSCADTLLLPINKKIFDGTKFDSDCERSSGCECYSWRLLLAHTLQHCTVGAQWVRILTK